MDLHFLADSVFAVVCAVMGTSFISLNTPDKPGLNNYRISLKVLAGAYLALSFFTILSLIFRANGNSSEYFTFLDLSISSIQALLFTFTLIVLINPGFVKLKNLFRYSLPYLVLLLLYSISAYFFGDPDLTAFSEIYENRYNPTVWVRISFLVYYFVQLIFYTRLFLKETKRYDEGLLNYFSEVVQLKLNWVRLAYFSALFVGVTVLVSGFLPFEFEWIFTLLFTIFYFGFAQEYIKYNKVYVIIESAIETPQTEPIVIPYRHLMKSDWEHYKKQILINKYYCQSGVNIEDLARKLSIGRTTLSNLINREEGLNFNSWINRLRIEDAKQLMLINPDFTIAIISELVGYTEQANFSRQFKQITGESPLYWRKKAAS